MDDRIAVGSVIRQFVTDTTPPKVKYFIIIGIDGNTIALGTVFINSKINSYFYDNPELLQLQIPISSSEYPILSWDSFIDCSDINTRKISEVLDCLDNDPRTGYCFSVTAEKLREIHTALDKSRKIPVHVKKKFGIR